MNLIVRALAVLSFAVVAAGCGGSPNLTCQTTTCSSGSNTYQVCSAVDGTVSYNYGGMSCSCPSGNTTQCQACAQMVAAYCGGGGGGGTGGTGGGGGGGSGGGGCTITLSGAATGTFNCTATTVYATQSNLGGPTLTVSAPAPYQMLTVTITRPGEPTSGTWSDADAGSKADLVVESTGVPPPTWVATRGASNGMDQGSYTMSITVSNPTTVSNGKTYTATGTIDGTLPFVQGTGASGSVTLHATF